VYFPGVKTLRVYFVLQNIHFDVAIIVASQHDRERAVRLRQNEEERLQRL